ncbi:MAG: DUF134 domain-containing protein [Candidatus Micrarchaeota archaeon]
MVRPFILRRVMREPGVTYFKPAGIPLRELKEVEVTVDEFEAFRLNDAEGLDQIVASKKMSVSQPTFHRLVSSAREKIAKALVEGNAIRIKGGVYFYSNKKR